MKVADVLFSFMQNRGLSQREFARKAGMKNPMPLTRLKQGALLDEENLRKAAKILPPAVRKKLREAYEDDIRTKRGNWRKLSKNQSESFACHRVEKFFTGSVEFSDIAVRTATKRSRLNLRLKGDVVHEVHTPQKRYLKQRDEEEHNRSIENLFAIMGKKEGEIFISGGCRVILRSLKDSLPDLEWRFYAVDSSAGSATPDFLVQGDMSKESHLPLLLRRTRIRHGDIYSFLLREIKRKKMEIAPWAIPNAKGNQISVDSHTISQFLERMQEVITIVEGRKVSIRKKRDLVLHLSRLKRDLQKSMYEHSVQLKLVQVASNYFTSKAQ